MSTGSKIPTAQQESSKNYSLGLFEQEITIVATRNNDHADIYASDKTYITKLDKMCEIAPENYSVVSETIYGKRYRCEDKTLISFRARKRELTDEQREQVGERMKAWQEKKRLTDASLS